MDKKFTSGPNNSFSSTLTLLLFGTESISSLVIEFRLSIDEGDVNKLFSVVFKKDESSLWLNFLA